MQIEIKINLDIVPQVIFVSLSDSLFPFASLSNLLRLATLPNNIIKFIEWYRDRSLHRKSKSDQWGTR